MFSEKTENFGALPYSLHVAMAPPKSTDRFELFLEKATELGISEITPIITEHSERTKLRVDRLEKILISAMKQSLSAYLPRLHPPVSFADFMEQDFSSLDGKFIGYCGRQLPHLRTLLQPSGKHFLALIGPEGDFSEKEFETAVEKGFFGMGLGSRRLRTETAGILVCALINAHVSIS